MIAQFSYLEVPENFHYKNFDLMQRVNLGPFRPHEPMDGKAWLEQRGDKVYCCYFHAGLRVYDVSDSYYIKELAYFIPPNPNKTPEESFFLGFPGPRNATTEDCIIDAPDDGFYILKMKEE